VEGFLNAAPAAVVGGGMPAEPGYDKPYGARSVSLVIQKHIK
jgi:hypothetical protein